MNPSFPRRCRAEIDLAALERNLRLIRASLPRGMRYVAVVKADAYGHGLQHVAGRLMHAGGSQTPGEISLGEFSGWADTIPWETLCSVTKRVPRIYKTALGT